MVPANAYELLDADLAANNRKIINAYMTRHTYIIGDYNACTQRTIVTNMDTREELQYIYR